jgi:aspartate racemase
MPIAGILGGLGPESTIDYYRRIIGEWQQEDPLTFPGVVIDSLDVNRGLYLSEHDHAGLARYLLESLMRLAGAGVDFIAMAANTPHLVFDELVERCPVPMVSIVETCAAEARRRGLTRLALLGTRFTMEAPFYPKVFARNGMAVVPPGEPDRTWAHEHYVGQLLKGDFRDSTRDGFISLITKLRDEDGIDGVILGGTELTLLLSDPDVAGVPALDTTALHVRAIVERLRKTV